MKIFTIVMSCIMLSAYELIAHDQDVKNNKSGQQVVVVTTIIQMPSAVDANEVATPAKEIMQNAPVMSHGTLLLLSALAKSKSLGYLWNSAAPWRILFDRSHLAPVFSSATFDDKPVGQSMRKINFCIENKGEKVSISSRMNSYVLSGEQKEAAGFPAPAGIFYTDWQKVDEYTKCYYDTFGIFINCDTLLDRDLFKEIMEKKE